MNPTRTPETTARETAVPYRILIVDDNPAIHADFKKILTPSRSDDFRADELESQLFGIETPTEKESKFELDHAHQGQEALAILNEALAEGLPYALAFVDVRMPPGWDGIETVNQLWKVDPGIQIVICTAYSDYS